MEDKAMLTLRSRAIAVAAAAAFTLATFAPGTAEARVRNGDAVAAAAIVGLFGAVAAIAAANARDRYEARYYRPPYAVHPGYGYGYRGPVHPGHRWQGWHRHHRHY
jgi:hypothetical protein